MKKMRKNKKGAASFYIVSISTLILVIIAASFAAVIISEITRTSNDDLAQSAYDSALAGVEDAKLAYYSYQDCKKSNDPNRTTMFGAEFNCGDLIEWIEKGEVPDDQNYDPCDMVAVILGRGSSKEGVLVQESDVDNNMQQYYTCVKITNKTKDVLGMVSESNPEYVVNVKFDGVDAEEIKKVKIQWHSDSDSEVDEENSRHANYDSNGGLFGADATIPAVISFGMIQTSEDFQLSDFDVTKYEDSEGRKGRTNRGTIYLVPKLAQNTIAANNDRFIDVTSNNIIDESGFLKSNDKTKNNLPYLITCDDKNDFACSATVDIPEPIGDSNRNNETFMFKVSLPYGGPNTRFSLEFYCGGECRVSGGAGGTTGSDQAILDGVQISIDSTGRANDLYRRVETRLEPEGSASYPYPLYAIQLLSGNVDMAIEKDLSVTIEHDFKF